jgi:hypothetical protein
VTSILLEVIFTRKVINTKGALWNARISQNHAGIIQESVLKTQEAGKIPAFQRGPDELNPTLRTKQITQLFSEDMYIYNVPINPFI